MVSEPFLPLKQTRVKSRRLTTCRVYRSRRHRSETTASTSFVGIDVASRFSVDPRRDQRRHHQDLAVPIYSLSWPVCTVVSLSFSFSNLVRRDGCRPLHFRDMGERYDKASMMFLLEQSPVQGSGRARGVSLRPSLSLRDD